MQVSRAGYYRWEEVSWAQEVDDPDQELIQAIGTEFAASHRTYGSPRVHQALVNKGFRVGRNRVAPLMREMGWVARPPRRFRKTTDSGHALPTAPNQLQRCFVAGAPNHVWVTDITFIRTWEGWLYLAVVIDLFSRMVVGWCLSTRIDAALVLGALRMALGRRVPGVGLNHHSDRGVQYASQAYQRVLAQAGISCRMSRKADCWDNAVAESFFSTLKMELIYRHPWPRRRRAMAAVVDYIELFYNTRRQHSFLGFVSPTEYEKMNTLEEKKPA